MPNWCENLLIVSGDHNQLAGFVEKSILKSDKSKPDEWEFTFKGIHPIPHELLEINSNHGWNGDETDIDGKKVYQNHLDDLVSKFGYHNCYDWSVANWGTKWDCNHISMQSSDNQFQVVYDTAWYPNFNWVKYASKAYPCLKFELKFYDLQSEFCGIAECKNGVLDYTVYEIVYVDELGIEVNPLIRDEDWAIFVPLEIKEFTKENFGSIPPVLKTEVINEIKELKAQNKRIHVCFEVYKPQ
jgi:hypothetical protein